MEVLTSRLTSLLKNSLFGAETQVQYCFSKTRYFLKYRLWTSRSCLVVFHHIYCNERQRTSCVIVGSLTSYNCFPSLILLWLSCKLQAIANLSKSEKSYEGRVVIVPHEFACWSMVWCSILISKMSWCVLSTGVRNVWSSWLWIRSEPSNLSIGKTRFGKVGRFLHFLRVALPCYSILSVWGVSTVMIHTLGECL
jgi:hypothetical protein